MAKKSIFARIREAASQAAEKVSKVWKKEEPKPLPEAPVKKKEAWIKKTFSKAFGFFRKQEETEIDKELKELKEREKELKQRRKQLGQNRPTKPVEPFEEVIPVSEPETFVKAEEPVEHLINQPEFEMERFRMLGIMKYLTEMFEKFASGYPFDSGEKTRDGKPIMLHPPATDMEPDAKPLADGSVIFQARFLDWGDDEDSYRNFMLMLESRIYTLGLSGTIRVSIAQQWDPRDLSIPYSIDESKGLITISETDLEYYKGMATIRQNVSLDIGASFSTARDNLYYKMRDNYLDGKEPKAIIVNIVWGESVIRMSRKAIRL